VKKKRGRLKEKSSNKIVQHHLQDIKAHTNARNLCSSNFGEKKHTQKSETFFKKIATCDAFCPTQILL
jgi:hypothetical protein